MALERVQKILAHAGITSRRKAEELILEGVVTINGKIAQLGDKADLGKDSIKVRGKLLTTTEAPVYLAFNKPRLVLSTLSDPEGRPTLATYLSKVKARVYPVGRLDFTSEGLILLTNDGAFAEKLQKQDNVARVYRVKVKGHPTVEMIEKLKKGSRMGGKLFVPHSVRLAEEYSKKASIEIVVLGAGALDLKTYFEHKGMLVDRMIRVAIGQVSLKEIAPGSYRQLKASQVQALLDQPELGLRMIEHEAKRMPEPKTEAEQAVAEENESKGRRIVVKRGPRVERDDRGGDRERRPAKSAWKDRSAPRDDRGGDRERRPAKFAASARPAPRDDRGGFKSKRPMGGKPSFGGARGDSRGPRGPRGPSASGGAARPKRRIVR